MPADPASPADSAAPQAGPADAGEAETPATRPAPRIRLLGEPRWHHAGRPEGETLAVRDAALLALLALEGAVPRDRAAAWLWPEVPQKNANLSLRQRVFKLRRLCLHPLIEVGATLRLASGVQVDLCSDPLPAEGELLAGLDTTPFEALDEWMQAARLTLGRRQADALAGQAAQMEARGAWAAAITLCERIVAAHPSTEHAWRRLMRLHWLRADRAAAIATFERFEQQVCRELGLRPSAETLALLEQVERLEAGARQAQPGLPPSLLHPPLLVGRDAELQALQQAWTEGRAVLLQASGGMGKSRLLQAFVQGRSGVLQGRARPGDATQPYGTMSHLLADALERFAPRLDDATRKELSRLLPGLGPPPPEPAQQLRLWRALDTTWKACMAQGMAGLVVDDLHWADTATLEQLRWQLASSALADLRFAFAARHDEDTPALPLLRGWLGDSLRVLPLQLAPLALAELQALLRSLALSPAWAQDPGLPAQLLRQTGGHPFFVLESLKTRLSGAGLAPAAPAPAPPGAAVDTPPPPAAEAMIQRRVQRLAPGARHLLQLLAVADGDLRLEVATCVLNRPLLDLANDWAELASAQLVHQDGVAHDLVRASVLAALPQPARRALHLALAQGLAQAPGVQPASLAPHWQAAQAWPQAGAAWLQAAQAAVRAGRMAEADTLFTQAHQALRAGADRAAQVQAWSQAIGTHLAVQGVEAVAAQLAEQVREPAAPVDRARLLLLQAEAEMARMAFEPAAAAAAQALTLAHAAQAASSKGAAEVLSDAHLLRGRALAWAGQPEAGVALMRQACAEAEALGEPQRRLRACALLADVLAATGNRRESVPLQEQAWLLAQELGNAFDTAVAASNLATFRFLVADAAGAYHAGRQAMSAMGEMGVAHVDRLMGASVFAFAAAHQGRFDEAMATAMPLLAEAGAASADPLISNLRNVLCALAMWRGRPDEAQALLPPEAPEEGPLSVRLTSLMTRLRWLMWTQAERSGWQHLAQQVVVLGERHPELREDPHFYRGIAPLEPAAQALAQLQRLVLREQAHGASPMLRSLQFTMLQVLQAHDPAAALPLARELLDTLPLGVHPTVYPPQAWWTVAQVLLTGDGSAGANAGRSAGDSTRDQAGARKALQQARQWIGRARLWPSGDEQAQACFLRDNPINRLVLEATD